MNITRLRKNHFEMIFLLILIAITLCLFAGCGNSATNQKDLQNKLSAYADQKITISGLTDKDFEITVADLMKLDTVTESAVSNRANGEEVKVKVTGPLLDTFLASYGKTQKNFSVIRFMATDNYSIAASSDILNNRGIILAFMDKGEALVKDEQPVKVIIPGERAMYWVKKLSRIDFETGDAADLCNKIIVIDTAVKSLPQEDYNYYGSVDKVIKTKDLIGNYADINDNSIKNIFMYSGDGLKKNETVANFLIGYLKITGEDIPRFLSHDLPQGMHVKDLLCVNYGTTAFFSMSQALKVLTTTTDAEQNTGIAFTDIVKKIGTVNAKSYKFTSSDGTSLELAITDMANAYVYQDSDGVVSFNLGYQDNEIVKDLISVELIK